MVNNGKQIIEYKVSNSKTILQILKEETYTSRINNIIELLSK